MAGLVRSFREVVHKLAYTTSVDQLKKKGIDKVNVLGMDRIAFLIQEAVKRSLRHKLIALDRDEVASATKEEFLRLIESKESSSRQQDELRVQKEQAEAEVEQLRQELAEQERLLVQRENEFVQRENEFVQRENEVVQRESLFAKQERTFTKKLELALHRALFESGLSEVTATKNLDEGVSSVYKEVQGLSPADHDYRRKRTLMSHIYEANMRLQKGP